MTDIFKIANRINGKDHQAETPRESGLEAEIRHDWMAQEVVALLTGPLLELVDRARSSIVRKDTAGLKEQVEALARTQRMFRGVASKE